MGKFKKWFEKFPELEGFTNNCYNHFFNSSNNSMYSAHITNLKINDIEEELNKTSDDEKKQELINKQKDIVKTFKSFKRLMNNVKKHIPYQNPLESLSKFTMDGNEYTRDDVLEMGDNINDFNKKKNNSGDNVPCCVCTKELFICNLFEYDFKDDDKFKDLGISSSFVIGSDCMETIELLQVISVEPKYKEIFEEKKKEWDKIKKNMNDKKNKIQCVKCEKLFEPYTNLGITTPMNVCKKCIKQIRKDREAEKVKKELEKQKQVEENIKQNREKILMIRKKKKEEEELFNLYWETYQW